MATLYIVPTPIGNLSDMTYRAVEVLKSVNLILAEDTRTSGKLLKHFQIENRLQSHHLHNEHKMVDTIVNRIKSGESVALISDAGTPAISDPGFLLVRACVKAQIKVETLPGATAFVPALVNSGLPCDRFFFQGFLPPKKGRQSKIKALSTLEHTFILYESPYKLVKTLTQLSEVCGENRQASISREISKLYEETVRGTLSELITHFKENEPKGEFVIVVEGKNE